MVKRPVVPAFALLAALTVAVGLVVHHKAKRTHLVPSTLPLSAVGVLELAGDTLCTASVVGRDIVLTAAHCLFAEDGRSRAVRRFRIGTVTAGAEAGIWAEARVIARRISESFDPQRFRDESSIDSADWALLRLDKPIGDQTGIVPVRVLAAAELERFKAGGAQRFVIIGYGSSQGRHAVVHAACPMLEWWDDHTYTHGCASVSGDSGAPNLWQEEGTYKIIGLESADVTSRAGTVAAQSVASAAFAAAVAAWPQAESTKP